MIQISTLASSSKGNASVVSDGETHLLIDTGISALRIRQGLQECGLTINDISGILYTHEHADHFCGLGVLAKKKALQIYCSRYLTRDIRAAAPNAHLTYIEPGCRFNIGNIAITPFQVNHDAADPLGYLFVRDGTRLGYVTDSGLITRGMRNVLTDLHGLYIESNFDPVMLRSSGRPYDLIARIEGDWGHLSNEQAAAFVAEIATPALSHIILGHISPECNTPETASAVMTRTISSLGLLTAVHAAHRSCRSPWITLPTP